MSKRKFSEVEWDDETQKQDTEPKRVPQPTVERLLPVLDNVTPSLSTAWFLLRLLGATAADISKYIGLSPYSSAQDAFWHMRHNPLQGLEPAPALAHGNFYEPQNIRMLSKRLGVQIVECPFRTDARCPWIRATPDGIVVLDPHTQQTALIECKCPYNAMYSSPPIQYVVQQFVQMRVYGLRVNYLSAWHPSGAMRVWRTHWNDDYWQWIYQRLQIYWTALRYDVEPTRTMLPWVVQPAQEHLDLQIKRWRDKDALDQSRSALVREFGLQANDLPPNVHIEQLHYDPVKGTGREFLENLTHPLTLVDDLDT